jgi:hypothetical protein
MRNSDVAGVADLDVGYEVATETRYRGAKETRDQMVTKTMLNKTAKSKTKKKTTPIPFFGCFISMFHFLPIRMKFFIGLPLYPKNAVSQKMGRLDRHRLKECRARRSKGLTFSRWSGHLGFKE